MEDHTTFSMWVFGLANFPWWGYVLVTLLLTHVTISSVTIFLHRHSAHRALELHPLLSHFFRFWLWLTTGMSTKAWTAIHRKHHATCETKDDPHSPQIKGIRKVFFEGAELYRAESQNKVTLEKYGHGTPNDWLENRIYSPLSTTGVGIMLVLNIIIFGPIGLSIWAVQMLWIPLTAAGVINGIGHYWGYRNFQTKDASKNIFPFGILIGGEELHNNHHAYPTSAKLSSKWYEFDIGWLYIKIFSALKLAHIKKIAPQVKLNRTENICNVDTLRAVILNRYEVLSRFSASIKKTYLEEINKINVPGDPWPVSWSQFKNWVHSDPKEIRAKDGETFENLLEQSPVLKTVYHMRQELSEVWKPSLLTKEELLIHLESWCCEAEESEIITLIDFSKMLRSYR